MAIYSGTAEVGKIYVGSAQIGKVYNNVGSLIYSAETSIYDAGTINTSLIGDFRRYITGNGTSVTFNTNNIYFKAYNDPTYSSTPAWGRACIWTTKKVNLAGYKTLNVYNTALTGSMFLLLEATSISGSDNPHLHNDHYIESSNVGTISMNLTNYQGSYYLGFCQNCSGSWYTSGASTVTKIWLE